MRTRGFRLTLLALLLSAALVGGLVVWSAQQRIEALDASEREAAARLSRIAELVSALGSAQLAYSAAPQTSDGWFGHVSRLVETVETETASLWEKASRTNEPPPQLRVLLNATSVVVQATARAKENRTAGSDLMAADLVLAEARQSVDAMAASLRNLKSAQGAAIEGQRVALEQRSWTVIGVVAGLWTLGLLALALPKSAQTASPPLTEATTFAPSLDLRVPGGPDSAPINLSAAAELCTVISRVTRSDEIPALLGRTAALIDASGIILWIAVGSDSLTAIASHGYESGLIGRISPIPLSVRNPTTAAWHAGSIRTVSSSNGSNAAIAAPILGPEGCIGVLAAEMRRSTENEPTVQSIVMIIAALFASIIASPSADERTDVLTGSGLDSESDLPLKAAGV